MSATEPTPKQPHRQPKVASSPVLIGAVTTLIISIAVFLAYNANKGLPFVPTFELKVDAPNAARLVVGNEVREGGFRIGQVAEIDPLRKSDGTTGAELTLKLDKVAEPLPSDTKILIRPRSALGLKYVDLVRGTSSQELEDGASITATEGSIGPELDDFFDVFDENTRENVDRNLAYFGAGLAGRGGAINRTLGALPELTGDLPPVMRTLSDPDTKLVPLIRSLERAAGEAAPNADALARGFGSMANTFEAISRDPDALRATIDTGPLLLDEGVRSLPAQIPFLTRLANISDEVRGTAREVRRSLPAVNAALRTGTRVLPRTVALNDRLERTLRETRDLARSETTDPALRGLTYTMNTLDPTLKYLGPHVTVCNYFTYFWTYLSDHLSEEDATGTVQRIQVKLAPLTQENGFGAFGASYPANGTGPSDPVGGNPAALHSQPYGRAVDEKGAADCESGQRGYPTRLAKDFPANLNIAVDPRTPGNQGPTFKGRERVPAGQTFSAEAAGIAPDVTP